MEKEARATLGFPCPVVEIRKGASTALRKVMTEKHRPARAPPQGICRMSSHCEVSSDFPTFWLESDFIKIFSEKIKTRKLTFRMQRIDDSHNCRKVRIKPILGLSTVITDDGRAGGCDSTQVFPVRD